jgi:hypothetical protein
VVGVTDPAPQPPTDFTEPLPVWSRVAAITLGAVGVTAGGVAVFVSRNQAGTAFLLLIGAVLLVLGIQGTPMRRLASGDNSVELATIRQRAAAVLTRVETSESPEVVAAVSDAVAAIDPRLPRASSAAAYQRAVAAALRRVGATTEPATTKRASSGRRVDAIAAVNDGRVPIEIVSRPQGPVGHDEIGATRSRTATVMITNAPVSSDALTHSAATGPNETDVEVVTWNDARDDAVLAAALTRNAR